MDSPFILVIFGATGDLTRKKLITALFSLYKQNKLGKDFKIVGFSRRSFTNEQFAELFTKHKNDSKWYEFAKHLEYQQGQFQEEEGYWNLHSRLDNLDKDLGGKCLRIFYLATPPTNYEEILDQIHKTKLAELDQSQNNLSRLAIEKPFGKDITTARMLDVKLAHIFDERQIYRVDHYLAKETMQNLLAFRFANSIFEPTWNNNFIDHVQITWFQSEDIEGRGEFFDGTGLLRDVGQNHIMQFIAAVAMEQPNSFTKEGVRDARAAAIKAIRQIKPEEVDEFTVRGQYARYRDEKHINPTSHTETFVALKLFVDTPRFKNVPFYLRAGKALKEEIIEISVVFIQTCHILFKEYGCPEIGNVLTFRIQPNEGIHMRVIAKKPGTKLELDPVDMHFTYDEAFKSRGSDAYDKLLLDILTGDQMLFNRSDELESSWEFITSILEGWLESSVQPIIYEKGSTGPDEANKLIEKDNRKWLF